MVLQQLFQAVVRIAANLTNASVKVVKKTIHSSMRPPAPRVVYVLPTFEWEPARNVPSLTRKRNGRGLRVYVERGWYASGEGERLAVVLARSANEAKTLADVVSHWGEDAAWCSSGTQARLTAADFEGADIISAVPSRRA